MVDFFFWSYAERARLRVRTRYRDECQRRDRVKLQCGRVLLHVIIVIGGLYRINDVV